jgi:hypothetical protein
MPGVTAADVYKRVADEGMKTLKADRELAIQHVMELTSGEKEKIIGGSGPLGKEAAESLVEKMKGVIENAPLIVSFKAEYLWVALNAPAPRENNPPARREYINLFQQLDRGEVNYKNSKDKNSKVEYDDHTLLRDRAEEVMFGYSRGSVWGEASSDPAVNKITSKIRAKGVYSVGNASGYWHDGTYKFGTDPRVRCTPVRFKASLRPRYATVNFARASTGPTGWGRSMLVYIEG